MSEEGGESSKGKRERLRKVKKLPAGMKMSVDEMLDIAEKKKRKD